MRRIRLLVVGSTAVVAIAGIGIATASTGASKVDSTTDMRARVISQLQALEIRAAANPAAEAALQHAVTALRSEPAAQGKPASPPPPCPSSAPNAGGIQPCGVVNHIVCPSKSPNAGNHPPCGQPSPKPTGNPPPPPAACGPADQGGTAATGPISGPLYDIGGQVTANGGAPLGDLVQTIACAVFTNLGL